MPGKDAYQQITEAESKQFRELFREPEVPAPTRSEFQLLVQLETATTLLFEANRMLTLMGKSSRVLDEEYTRLVGELVGIERRVFARLNSAG